MYHIQWLSGLCGLLLVTLIWGCSKATPPSSTSGVRPVALSAIQGEWQSKDGYTYMHIRGDSIVYMDSTRPFRHFSLSSSNEVIIERDSTHNDTIGRLAQNPPRLIFSDRYGGDITLWPANPNTSIHLKKIQLSAGHCYFVWCPEYDVEITRNQTLVAIQDTPKAGRHSRLQSRTFRALPQNHRNPSAVFREIETIIQKGLNDKFAHQWITDARQYSLAIFYNDTVSSFTFTTPETSFPPRLRGLIPYLFDPIDTYSRVPLDTTVFFSSRLNLCRDLPDSLDYLHTFYPRLYRQAQFPGGEKAFEKYVRHALGKSFTIDKFYCFDITIGTTGHVEEVVNDPADMADKPEMFAAYEKALQSSPRWEIALRNGQPVRYPARFCISPPDEVP